MTKEVNKLLDSSVQVKREDTGLFPAFLSLYLGDDIIPPWWSPRRDLELKALARKSNHLSGAIGTFQSKITNMGWRVKARDESVRTHVQQALDATHSLQDLSEFGQGWETLIDRYINDLIITDNGGFMEVIGKGAKDRELQGRPMALANLDATYCQRTGDPIFPVIFTDIQGTRYKLHHTRVIYRSWHPSPDARMYGVGFSPVSRATTAAQNLYDISVYKMEELGSRPKRGMIVTKGGLSPEDLDLAFRAAEMQMNAQDLSRYSKIVAVGDSALPDASAELIDLAGLPEGFNEETSTIYGMALIALALEVDVRELWPTLGVAASRAEALLSHIKQRSRGIGYVLKGIEHEINTKFLPHYLEFVFDNQDDAQDKETAEIRNTRSMTRERDINSGLLDTRTARLMMMKDGDITESNFEDMELASGRLPDGSNVISLFESDDIEMMALLRGFNPQSDDEEAINQRIYENEALLLNVSRGRPSPDQQRKIRWANAALTQLLENEGDSDEPQEEEEQDEPIRSRSTLIADRRADRRPATSENPLDVDNVGRGPRADREGNPDLDADSQKGVSEVKPMGLIDKMMIPVIMKALSRDNNQVVSQSQPQVTVNVPPIEMPEVNLTVEPQIIVQPATVNVPETVVNVPAPIVNVEQFPPDVNVNVPAPIVNVDSPVVNMPEIKAPDVTVNVPEAQVTVENKVELPSRGKETTKVTRDKAGRISGSETTVEYE